MGLVPYLNELIFCKHLQDPEVSSGQFHRYPLNFVSPISDELSNSLSQLIFLFSPHFCHFLVDKILIFLNAFSQLLYSIISKRKSFGWLNTTDQCFQQSIKSLEYLLGHYKFKLQMRSRDSPPRFLKIFSSNCSTGANG